MEKWLKYLILSLFIVLSAFIVTGAQSRVYVNQNMTGKNITDVDRLYSNYLCNASTCYTVADFMVSYNETDQINAVNTSDNIKGLGFNLTTEIQTWVESLYSLTSTIQGWFSTNYTALDNRDNAINNSDNIQGLFSDKVFYAQEYNGSMNSSNIQNTPTACTTTNTFMTRYLGASSTCTAIDFTVSPEITVCNTTYCDYVTDGIADDVQIQSALDAATLISGTVLILDGTYDISSRLNVSSNTTLSGTGWGTRLTFSDEVNDRMISNTDWEGGNENIIIKDMYIDGNKQGQSSLGEADEFGNAGTLHFDKVINLVVTGLRVDNGWGAAIETINSSYIDISNNRIHLSADDGIGINDDSFYVTVSNNIITEAGYDGSYGSPNGIEIQDGSHHVTVFGNAIKNSSTHGISINTHSGGGETYQISISGNTIIDSGSSGVDIAGRIGELTHSITVDGNTMEQGIRCVGSNYARDVVISNNVCIGPSTRGIGMGADESTFWTITGNLLVNSTTAGGILIRGRSIVSNNIIRGFNGSSAYSISTPDSLYSIITDNIILNGDIGIGIFGDFTLVSGNSIANDDDGKMRWGIYSYSGSTNNTIIRNTFFGLTSGNVGDAGDDNMIELNYPDPRYNKITFENGGSIWDNGTHICIGSC